MFNFARSSPGLDRKVPLSMAAAITGAMLPIFRCSAWLNLVTTCGVGVARTVRPSRWHGLQTAGDGSRLSEAFVLVVAAVWHLVHGRFIERCTR